ncbi:hypothetical protein FOPPYZMZ_CDS0258 [Pseudomonas phage 9Ps-7B]|nr:hypothetical protein [Pseudomonas phage ANB1]WRQ05693.1 hypothetical protein IPCDMZAV_CDS0170 [Pseudomonas phage 6B]WRQ06190.1 hypothetical protein QAMIJHJT_CDS0259 [Pseudomonas phage 9-Ps-8B]WRQ06598.1 hypothetical protein FOPPYZMZ_CDS0258 [Pseudomonas phage 9Ps-7B]WRQ06949.1 hypothetical protein ZBUARNPM_CDS0200 [Pseudomonas phage 14Ps5-6]
MRVLRDSLMLLKYYSLAIVHYCMSLLRKTNMLVFLIQQGNKNGKCYRQRQDQSTAGSSYS